MYLIIINVCIYCKNVINEYLIILRNSLFRMIASVLEVLESSFILSSHDDNKSSLKATAIDVASRLLILPTPPSVQMHTTALLAALHSTKQAYHFHKVYKNRLFITFINDYICYASFTHCFCRIMHYYRTFLNP